MDARNQCGEAPVRSKSLRAMHSCLMQLEAENSRGASLYLGREEDEKQLRRALAVPRNRTPIAIHAVGHYGIGRRSFIRQGLNTTYPRTFAVFPEVTLGKFDGIEELYRSIYEITAVRHQHV